MAPHRRGIASGARVLVQNTGAVLSIALVMATGDRQSVPKSVAVQRVQQVSALGSRIPRSAPFLTNLHLALWILCGVSVLGVFISFSRPKHIETPTRRSP